MIYIALLALVLGVGVFGLLCLGFLIVWLFKAKKRAPSSLAPEDLTIAAARRLFPAPASEVDLEDLHVNHMDRRNREEQRADVRRKLDALLAINPRPNS